MQLTDLLCYVAGYPELAPRTYALEQRIKIGTGFHNKWFSSQKEHWLGWLVYQQMLSSGITPKVVWNRLKSSPMMFYLAESGGVDNHQLNLLEDAVSRAALINSKDGNPHGKYIRETLPWEKLELTICKNQLSCTLDQAQKIGDKSFANLCRHHPKYGLKLK